MPTITLDKFIPIIIKILSERLQNRTTENTNDFFNPWLITNKFWGPIAIIKVDPIINPWIKS